MLGQIRIYVFGNSLVAEDSSAIGMLDQLRDRFSSVEFEAVDPNENIPLRGERDILILDTVVGVSEPMLLDLGQFDKKRNYKTPVSPHDYDLWLHLQLLRKTGRVDKIQVIAVPQKISSQTVDRVARLIKELKAS